ncbi:hypothetical protein MKX08_008356 [Trichoderma sp. CBMAI-0020]|nr:hypothetical protein MKX08_008356 [Trichoderma sp. CBMAI-0020]
MDEECKKGDQTDLNDTVRSWHLAKPNFSNKVTKIWLYQPNLKDKMLTSTVVHIPRPSMFSKQNPASAWQTTVWFDRLDTEALKEIVVFEKYVQYFHQSFNHHTRVVIHDRDGAAMDYSSAGTETLGRLLSWDMLLDNGIIR